nr:perilipin-3-like [Pogona vitticeps]
MDPWGGGRKICTGDPASSVHPSVVTRVASLPLVTSTYDLLSSVYAYAKENYPCINTACNVAEMVASMAVGSAKGGVQPLVGHLEPQIAAMNEYACKGLDTLEERVPCLHQPAHQVTNYILVLNCVIEEGVTLAKSVVGSTVHTAMDAANGAKHLFTHRVTAAVDLTKDIVQDSVALTKMVVNSTVNTALSAANEAKTLVSHRVTDVVNLSKETAQESVDLTKAVVSSTVNTALQAAAGTKDLLVTGQVKNCGSVQEGIEMGSFIQQLVATGVDAVLEKTEEMIDYYLPMTEEELVKLATEVQGFGPPSLEDQRRQQSYFVRLGSLSSKVRQRASLHSLSRLNLIKENTQNTLSQLQRVINLVEHLKEGVGQQFQEAQLKLHQLVAEWTGTQPGDASVGDTPPETLPVSCLLHSSRPCNATPTHKEKGEERCRVQSWSRDDAASASQFLPFCNPASNFLQTFAKFAGQGLLGGQADTGGKLILSKLPFLKGSRKIDASIRPPPGPKH